MIPSRISMITITTPPGEMLPFPFKHPHHGCSAKRAEDSWTLAVGTGLFVRYIEKGGSAVGIDVSRKMIERAQHRCIAWIIWSGPGENSLL